MALLLAAAALLLPFAADGAPTRAQQAASLLVVGLLAGFVVSVAARLAWRAEGARALARRGALKRKLRDGARRHFAETFEPWVRCHREAAEVATSYPASALLEAFAARGEGAVTPSEAMAACVERALRLGARHGCNAEECFADALDAAELATQDYALGRAHGLLHGLPLSVKDQFEQRGCDSTCGLAGKTFAPAARNGLLLKLLVKEGAIPFVRSNVPQGLLVPETQNNVWGTASNPYATDRSCGGSSGGEGVLVGGGAAPIGIGTDIGGSVRGPAAYCGCYALKPTPTRLSTRGLAVPRPRPYTGQEAILSTAGPFGRSTDDLALVMRAWLCDRMWEADPDVPRLPFRLPEYEGRGRGATARLRVGYFDDDGYFAAAPAARRAVREAVEALRERGDVELVPWTPPEVPRMVELYTALMGADALGGVLEGVGREATLPLYRTMLIAAGVPRPARAALAWLLRALGQRRMAAIVAGGGAKSTAEYWRLCGERKLYRARFHSAWRAARLDAVIGPATALPAWKHGQSRDLIPSLSYLFLYNLMAMPAGVVPITRTRPDETRYEAPEGQADRLATLAARCVAGSEGLPVAVQVAAPPNDDEVALRVMKMIEEEVQFEVGAIDAEE